MAGKEDRRTPEDNKKLVKEYLRSLKGEPVSSEEFGKRIERTRQQAFNLLRRYAPNYPHRPRAETRKMRHASWFPFGVRRKTRQSEAATNGQNLAKQYNRNLIQFLWRRKMRGS